MERGPSPVTIAEVHAPHAGLDNPWGTLLCIFEPHTCELDRGHTAVYSIGPACLHFYVHQLIATLMSQLIDILSWTANPPWNKCST